MYFVSVHDQLFETERKLFIAGLITTFYTCYNTMSGIIQFYQTLKSTFGHNYYIIQEDYPKL